MSSLRRPFLGRLSEPRSSELVEGLADDRETEGVGSRSRFFQFFYSTRFAWLPMTVFLKGFSSNPS